MYTYTILNMIEVKILIQPNEKRYFDNFFVFLKHLLEFEILFRVLTDLCKLTSVHCLARLHDYKRHIVSFIQNGCL